MSYQVGKIYSIPCILHTINQYKGQGVYQDELLLVPVHPNSHNDKENKQAYKHYHANFQFINHPDTYLYIRINDVGQKVEYHDLMCIETAERAQVFATPVTMIKKSKLKYQCIHKGKCPHRGTDLTGVGPINGIIECPLHGLKFNAETKQLIQ